MTSCARPSRDGISEAAPHTTFFYHFGAHGGWKPDRVIREWASGRRDWASGAGGGCDPSLVGGVTHNWIQLEAMGRATSWGRRTLAELQQLSAAFARSRNPVDGQPAGEVLESALPLRARRPASTASGAKSGGGKSGGSLRTALDRLGSAAAATQYAQLNATAARGIDQQLQHSRDILAAGMKCIERSLMLWDKASRSGQSAAPQRKSGGGRFLPHDKVMQTVGGSEVLARSISLRAAACSSCRWASYTAASRYEAEHTTR